jgi:hypothetical protein
MSGALAYATGIAISPVAIAATLLLLTCRRAVTNAISFLVGSTVGVAALVVAFVLLVNSAGLSDSNPLWIAVAELALGAGFLLAVAVIWWRRHERSSDAPPWVDAIGGFTSTRSAGLGVVPSGAYPKVIALSLSAALSQALYLTMPSRASSLLVAFRGRLARHETAILMVVGLIIGATFLTDALDGL